MLKFLSASALAATAVVATPASAVTLTVPLGVIVVPPTQTFSLGLTFLTAGANEGQYTFTISQPRTLTVSSFTNSAVGSTGVFDFSSIGLYSGIGSGGIALETGTITPRQGGTTRASLDPYQLGIGTYTIAYTGNVIGQPSSVGSSITFAAGAVPEPSTWAMMMLGFGGISFALRRRQPRVTTRVRFA